MIPMYISQGMIMTLGNLSCMLFNVHCEERYNKGNSTRNMEDDHGVNESEGVQAG